MYTAVNARGTPSKLIFIRTKLMDLFEAEESRAKFVTTLVLIPRFWLEEVPKHTLQREVNDVGLIAARVAVVLLP